MFQKPDSHLKDAAAHGIEIVRWVGFKNMTKKGKKNVQRQTDKLFCFHRHGIAATVVVGTKNSEHKRMPFVIVLFYIAPQMHVHTAMPYDVIHYILNMQLMQI